MSIETKTSQESAQPKFDISKFDLDSVGGREKLMNHLKQNIDQLKNNKDIIKSCKNHLEQSGLKTQLTALKEGKLGSKSITRETFAMAYLLVAIEKGKNNPSKDDLIKYFKNYQEVPNVSTEKTTKTPETPETPKTTETTENLKENKELTEKRMFLAKDLELKTSGGKELTEETINTVDVFSRKGYNGLYKFSDDGADLIYISDAGEKKGTIKQINGKNMRARKPNQIYKFDDNYKIKNNNNDLQKLEITDKIGKGKKVEGDPDGNGEIWVSMTNGTDWRKNLNKEDFYTTEKEQKDQKDQKDQKYKFTGKNWEEIKEAFENLNTTNSANPNADKKKKVEIGTKKKEVESGTNKWELKRLKTLLSSTENVDEDLTSIKEKESAIPRNKITEKMKEYTAKRGKLNEEYKKLLQDPGNNQSRIEEIKREVSGLKEKRKELTRERDKAIKKINKIRKKAIKKLEKGIAEKNNEIAKNGDGEIKKANLNENISEMTKILENQKIMLHIGDEKSEYKRNGNGQITKKDNENDIYVMNDYGILEKEKKE